MDYRDELFGRQLAKTRRERRLASARATVAVITSLYFVTLIAMIVYLSRSLTTLLTPHDPLLWLAAKTAFIAISGAWLLSFAKMARDIGWGAWQVVASFLPRMMLVALMSAVMAGLWAYLAANVYVTARTFGGHVEHGTMLLAAEPGVSLHGRPTIHAHLIDRAGRDVLITIDEADAQLLKQRPDPSHEPACVTVPVQWAGNAIRAEAHSDNPLPKGSISACS